MSTDDETNKLDSDISLGIIGPQVSEQALQTTGIRVGTLIKTKSMEKFIDRTKADGLHLIDINQTLSRIEVAGKFLSRHDPTSIVVYSSREYGKTPSTKFAEVTGTMGLVSRFMPGTFTNPRYPKHIDPEVVIVSDPDVDSQAVIEASTIGIPVIAICDTDNVCKDVDLVIPANNRGRKALAAVMWLLARSFLINIGKLSPDEDMKYTIDDFETKILDE